jgi:hypothetical protein
VRMKSPMAPPRITRMRGFTAETSLDHAASRKVREDKIT